VRIHAFSGIGRLVRRGDAMLVEYEITVDRATVLSAGGQAIAGLKEYAIRIDAPGADAFESWIAAEATLHLEDGLALEGVLRGEDGEFTPTTSALGLLLGGKQ
jgi:hypothetical protein